MTEHAPSTRHVPDGAARWMATLAAACFCATLGYGLVTTHADGGLDGGSRRVRALRIAIIDDLHRAAFAQGLHESERGRYFESVFELDFLRIGSPSSSHALFFGPGPGAVDPLSSTVSPELRAAPVLLPGDPASSLRDVHAFAASGCPVTPLHRFDGTVALDGPGVVNVQPYPHETRGEAYLMVAAVNLDDDPALDCWSIVSPAFHPIRQRQHTDLSAYGSVGDRIVHEQDDLAE